MKKKKTKLPKIGKRVVKNISEFNCYQKLQELIDKTLIVEYETEDLSYTINHKYKPDFPIRFKKKDGTLCYVEYKGNGRAFTNQVRQKMIAVKEQHPDSKFYIVFHTDGKCGPTRKDGSFMKQSDWATRHGFEFCIGADNIKKEWFNED